MVGRSSLLILLASALSVSATPKLSVKLSGARNVNDASDLKVTATVTNTGDETLKLLNDPRGPLSNKLPTQTFQIARQDSGAKPAFTGAVVKYVPSTAIRIGGADAFTVLAPGQSVNVEHDLTEAYDFTSSGQGLYTLTGANKFYFVDPNTNEPTLLTADAVQPHTMSVSSAATTARPSPVKREAYTACSPDQQTAITAAASMAQAMVADSFTHAQAHTARTIRYQVWFGAYSDANHATVLTNYASLNNGSYAEYSYDCSCNIPSVFGYARPDQYGKVTLCNAFWDAPVNGTDSQGGTLVHVGSYFYQNGGTIDYTYGQEAAIELAQTTPDEAVQNADNYEYFAENNPVLS
ncbi:deuterolysin M35 metalloprotease [Irpex rosettiformis]|uniref:Deuterolysin M35 metalloprotease n=1 Tax=Irpex rosettiformis TaxID=378272 RepID=A0ACB8UJ57_9APHY|nr:deuterolysin M35 metalloprotease [Irpex rosettiformis]